MRATHLKLPLRRHNLGIAAGDFHPGIQTGPIVSLDDLTTDHFVGANAAIIGALRAREAVLGPTKRPAIEIQQSVLLLDTKPGILILDRLHRLVRAIPLIRFRRRLVAVIRVAENELVVTATEWIIVNGHRVQEYIAVGAISLVRRAAIVRPRRQFWKR